MYQFVIISQRIRTKKKRERGGRKKRDEWLNEGSTECVIVKQEGPKRRIIKLFKGRRLFVYFLCI
jgi:hypothetical protein